ncbi:MAG TPA: hypothetical protein DD624_08610, partial [Alphaproteobacteria bacterium]|nr:hypothetical protein [Alphaproteobacteria bacterium]
MLICSKMKKTFVTTALAIAMIPSVASACNPVNPICLFQKMMKATPGLPVLDFVSIPAMIPNTPAALLKEAQNKAKEIVDKKFQKAHAEEKTDDVKMDKVPSLSAMEMAPNQEFSSLESFPKMDSEDPLEIAKAIEVLFLRPGWQDKKALSSLSAYDEALMMYYRDAFQLNNIVELVGTYAILDAKIEELMAAAEAIQKKVKEADDLNKSQRASYEADLLDYQLSIIQNELAATELQVYSISHLVAMKPILDEPVLTKVAGQSADKKDAKEGEKTEEKAETTAEQTEKSASIEEKASDGAAGKETAADGTSDKKESEAKTETKAEAKSETEKTESGEVKASEKADSVKKEKSKSENILDKGLGLVIKDEKKRENAVNGANAALDWAIGKDKKEELAGKATTVLDATSKEGRTKENMGAAANAVLDLTVKDEKTKAALSGAAGTAIDFTAKDGNKDVNAAIKQGIDLTVKDEKTKEALKGVTDTVSDFTSKDGKKDVNAAIKQGIDLTVKDEKTKEALKGVT